MNIMNVARETGLKDSFVVQCLGWYDSCYLPPKENSGPKVLKGRQIPGTTPNIFTPSSCFESELPGR
jgi:hypothetical protein